MAIRAIIERIRSTQRIGFPKGWRIFAALLVVALGIRLPLMAFRGYYGDLATYIRWGNDVTQHFFSIYTSSSITVGGGRFPGGGAGFPGGFPGGRGNLFGPGGGGFGFGGGGINYPPGTLYLFGLVVWLYNSVIQPLTHSSLAMLMQQNGLGPFLAKMPLLLADLATILLLYVYARRSHSERFALVIAAAWAFSPAVLYNGVAWGQTDALVALPVLVALFAVVAERYALAGVSLALAVLLKPQPIILVPLVALYLWRWTSRRQFARFAVAGILTALLVLLPVMIPNFQLGSMLDAMRSASYNSSLSLSSDAFNVWWLIGWGQQAIGSTFLGVQSGLVGDMLFGAVTLLCAVQIWRRRDPMTLALALATQAFGFFLFMGGQHERYLFLVLPLALAAVLLAEGDQRMHMAALYVIATALCFLNMLVGVGGGIAASGEPLPFITNPALADYLSVNFGWLSELLAALHVAAFGYALYLLLTDRWFPLSVTSAAEVAAYTASS